MSTARQSPRADVIADLSGGDEQAVLSVSVPGEVLGVQDVALSLPRVVGAAGVTATLWPELDAAETEGLRASAEVLKGMVEAV